MNSRSDGARAALFLAVFLPAFAVSWGVAQGERLFVLYRAPKLAAILACTGLLIAALAWWRPDLFALRRIGGVLRRPAVGLGVAVAAWSAVTGTWALVPQHAIHELVQIVVVGALWLLLVGWIGREPEVGRVVRGALVASLGFVTLIGLLQLLGVKSLLALFPAIDPELGVPYASLFGYKNPAAHAVAGQIFLVAGWMAAPATSRRMRGFLGTVLAAELVYLVSLRSRTALFAVGVAATVLVLAGVIRGMRARDGAWIRWGVGAAVAVGLVLVVAGTRPDAAERLRSVGGYVASPSSYLESDRGVYLRNTLHMARHRPWGVGLGNWQSAYPVFRAHDRSWAFDGTFEVRRAHSDHVQMLGETGWLGLGLWITWLAVLVVIPWRRSFDEESPGSLFVAAQVVVFVVAMATDYVVEMPYGKLQFLLVAALALAPSVAANPEDDGGKAGPHRPGWAPAAPFAVVLLTALVSTVAALALTVASGLYLEQRQVAAEIQRRYLEITERPAAENRLALARLASIADLDERYDRLDRRLPFDAKTSHRDHLVLSHLAQLRGDETHAFRHARRAVELHPYSPAVLAWTARLMPEPCADAWRRAHRYVRDEATAGFEGTYPGDVTACAGRLAP